MQIIALGALVTIYVSTVYASSRFAYRKAYWFFEVAHFCGGFFIAMLSAQFIDAPGAIVGATLCVGILWEIMELIIDRSETLQRLLKKLGVNQGAITLPDTLLDLVLDVTGSITFIFFLK